MSAPHRFARPLLCSLLACEAVILLLKAGGKLLWYDEVVTFDISSLHPFSRLYAALEAGADGMPPVYYALVQIARTLPGPPEILLRLPSILALLAVMLAAFLFLRRSLGPHAGVAGALLISLSPFREYGYEARSYAVLVGMLALAAVAWQRIGERRWMTPLFGLCLALAVACHPTAILLVAVFGLAELAAAIESRRIRWGACAACAAAAVPWVAGLPLLLHFRSLYNQNFWARPRWDTTLSTYNVYLGCDPKFVLILIVLFVLVIRKRPKDGPALRELVLIGALSLDPAALVVLAKLSGSAYVPRYGWPAVFGLVLMAVYLLSASRFSGLHLLLALIMVYALRTVAQDVPAWLRSPAIGTDPRWTALAQVARGVPDLPVVIGGALSYVEAAHYAPRDLRDRLIGIGDPALAVRYIGSDTTDRANQIVARFASLRVPQAAPFLAANPKFLLKSGEAADWFTPYLMEQGYRLKPVSPGSSLYLAER
jgi:4-amino-4-deoxy-L-arabinose transferase-like glycosyltransferase